MNTVYVSDFGAVGDGATDDSAAILAAMASFPDAGGTLLFGYGDYVIDSAIVFQPASGRDFVSNIHWRGVGGHHTDLGTRIQLNGGDGTTASMALKSAVQMTFENINFIGQTSSIAALKIQAAGADPFYSSFNIVYRNCRFSCSSPANAIVWLNNCSNITFDNCSWQGAVIAVQIGSNSSDAENSGTFGGGTADQVVFRQCLLAGDVAIYRCRGVRFEDCIYDQNTAAGTRGIRIYAVGDQLVRDVVISGGWAGYGDGTGDFYTMGASGHNLTVTDGFYCATYAKGFVLNGIGVAHIEGNEFALNTSGAMGIHISAAGFYGDNVQNNYWAGMHASAYRVKDSRSNPGAPPLLAPLEVNDYLGTDQTITQHGVGYEDILTESVKITGGHYRIQFAATITNGATAGAFRARVVFDAYTPRIGGEMYLGANQSGTLAMSRDIILDGVTSNTTARLQVYQLNGANAGTVQATDTVYTTMMQVTRMNA